VFVWETTQAMISEGLEPTLELLAGKVSIQPRVLQRALATGGLTMRSIVERIRVSIAENLLADTTDSILDVALATGYTSHQALSKVFKRWRGLAPKEYRFFVERNRPEPNEKLQQASHRDQPIEHLNGSDVGVTARYSATPVK
jgi:AraC-like DNA-binding protein